MKKLIFLLLLSQYALADGTYAKWMFDSQEQSQREFRQKYDNKEYFDTKDYETNVIIWDSKGQRNCYYSGGIMFCSD